jgi:Fe-S oxidoreductase/nitrate reductase gamma subunit
MYGLLAVTLVIGFAGVFRRFEWWSGGKAAPEYWGNWLNRLDALFGDALLQHKVRRGGSSAVAHLLVYLGFLALTFATTMVLIHHDLGIEIYRGEFYLLVTLMADVFGLGLLLGLGYFVYRRYIQNADLVHNTWNDAFVLGSLSLLCIQGFVLEGLRIHVTNDPWALYSPVGLATAKFFWSLSHESARTLHYGMWWFHTLTVYTFLALLPYTKFFHIVSSSLNLFFASTPRPMGRLAPTGDIQALMEQGEEFSLGLGTIKDYSWKNLLDLDACTQCGRCQDACPAYLTGKPLSPKWVILDTRNHALALQAKPAEVAHPRGWRGILGRIDRFLLNHVFLPGNGLTPATDGGWTGNGAFRGTNLGVQQSVRKLGQSSDARIAGDVIDPNTFWSCTTCMACVEACPVGINHVDQIVGNRRNLVMMQGELPSEAQATLRTLERVGNPYAPQEERVKWFSDLDVRVLQPGDSVDYLYWVGCVSAFDPRKQKIARALVTIMKKAGLSFGVLGSVEGCSGDPARRLGDENLFQVMAKSNIEVLRGVTFKTLVANCPHCFNSIKNEYPEFGNLGPGKSPEIIHHSVLLKRLLAEELISVSAADENSEITFHDPCYLGRYNGEYDAPRDTLKAIKGLKILEMDRSREKGLCCGAGGGHFWMDLKVGERVNSIRAEEAAGTGASTVATACPFCMQMMEDGVKLKDSSLNVRDIAEVIAERLR